ncbi:hypothetical protein ES708_26161 [subsurface metagenome]
MKRNRVIAHSNRRLHIPLSPLVGGIHAVSRPVTSIHSRHQEHPFPVQVQTLITVLLPDIEPSESEPLVHAVRDSAIPAFKLDR